MANWNAFEARKKRREHRKLLQKEQQFAERTNKENLIAAVKAYHLKCVEYHKALKDARDLIAGAMVCAEPECDAPGCFLDIEYAALQEIVAEIDAVLTPAPRTVPSDSIPAQVRLQHTLDEMRDRGEFPPGTEGKAV